MARLICTRAWQNRSASASPGVYTDTRFFALWVKDAMKVAQNGKIIEFAEGVCRTAGKIVPCPSPGRQPRP